MPRKVAETDPAEELAIRALLAEDAAQKKQGAVYPGNLGAMEMFKFYRVATPAEKALMERLTRTDPPAAWELLKKVTGVPLKDPPWLHRAGKTAGFNLTRAFERMAERRPDLVVSGDVPMPKEEAGLKALAAFEQDRRAGLPEMYPVEIEEIEDWWDGLGHHAQQKVLQDLKLRQYPSWEDEAKFRPLVDYYLRNQKRAKTAKSNAKVVEVPASFSPVVLEEPQAKRKEFPFEGFIDFQGLKIDVENAKGSTRSGEGPEGPWTTHMFAHYGEIRGTEGTDGDKLDVYVGDNHDSSLVVVIHQHNPWDGQFDEDKVVLGCESVEEAIGLYKKQYDRPGFFKDKEYTAMPIGAFWRWVNEEKNKGKRVKMARTAAPKWVSAPRLDAAVLQQAVLVKWVRITSSGQMGEVVAGKQPNGWNVQYLKSGESFDHKVVKGRPKNDAQVVALFKETGGTAPHVVWGSNPAGALPTQAPVEVARKHLDDLVSHLPQYLPEAIKVRSTSPANRMPRTVLVTLPGKSAVIVDLGLTDTASNGVVLVIKAKGEQGVQYQFPSSPMRFPSIAAFLGHVLQQYVVKVAPPAKPGAPAAAPMSAPFTTDEVTSFLKGMSTKTGGRNRDVNYYAPGSESWQKYAAWSVEPSNRQRLDHYVGQNYWPDEDEDPEGWDSEGWEQEYAGPLRLEVRQKLDARFGSGMLDVDIGEKGHIDVQLTDKGAQALGLMGKTALWKKGYTEGKPGAINAARGLSSQVLAAVRAMAFNYQTSHWQVAGDTSYGDHLLFERLYEATQAEVDGLAEKLVGLFGKEAVDGFAQSDMLAASLDAMSRIGCPFERSLRAEQQFQALLKKAVKDLEGLGQLSLGLDDMLRTMANDHETPLYLLQQRLGGARVAGALRRPDPTKAVAARYILKASRDWDRPKPKNPNAPLTPEEEKLLGKANVYLMDVEMDGGTWPPAVQKVTDKYGWGKPMPPAAARVILDFFYRNAPGDFS